MSAKSSSTFLLPPMNAKVSGDSVGTFGRAMRGTQSAQQLDESAGWTEVARLHSVGTRQLRISSTSASNVFRSLSTIHRSVSALPASLLDLDTVSTAGLQVIRPDTHPEAFVPVPPDGGWGWVVVVAAFITNLIIDGICVSFGIMVTDLVEHFNTSVSTVMLMGSLMLGVYQIVGPMAASLVNRFGCRAVGIVGSLLATVSMFVSAFMPTIDLMLVSYGVFAGAAFGLLHLPSIICVSFYFDSRRALAIGVTSCGTPLGAMIFAPLSEMLLQNYGWSNTMILFAGMLLNCSVFATLYWPLTPALVLTPLRASEAKEIQSLLQLAAGEEKAAASSGDRLGLGNTMSSIGSQHNLRDQPVLEEDEEAGKEEGAEDGEKEKLEKQRDAACEQGRKSDDSPPKSSKAGQETFSQPQLETISECPEGEMGGKAKAMARKQEPQMEKTKGELKLQHHRHHGRRKERRTLYNQLQQKYALWLLGVRLLGSAGAGKKKNMQEGEKEAFSDAIDDVDDGVNRVIVQSDVSTCGSSCEHESSHWDSDSTSDSSSISSITSMAEMVADEVGIDASTVTGAKVGVGVVEMRPLKKTIYMQNNISSSRAPVLQDKKSTVRQQETSTTERIISAPSLNRVDTHLASTRNRSVNTERRWQQQQQRRQRRRLRRPCHLSECQSSRAYTRLIPQQSVMHLANVAVSWRRPDSVTANALTCSHLSSIGSAMSASTMGGDAGTGGGVIVSLVDLVDNAPVIVELPHESITIEDYARPLYRKDIFFPGSVKRQIGSSTALAATARTRMMAENTMGTGNDKLGGSQLSVGMADGVRRRKTTLGTSQFGSSIFFGENVPLPPAKKTVIGEESVLADANWTGSCLMSLTKIPLPDVFKQDEQKGVSALVGADTETGGDPGVFVKDQSQLWDQLKVEAEVNRLDKRADGIFRVPRSHSLCGWWLCWETRRMHGLKLRRRRADEVECYKHSFVKIGEPSRGFMKFPQHTRFVLIRTCVFLPKSMFDVLVTMMNLALLKEKNFSIYCLASLTAVMGIYVPLFFVCDLANSFNIPQSYSAYLLTVYGGASILSRLVASWAAGQPKISATMLCALTLLLAGVAVCLMPYWGTLSGQVFLMVVFGLAVSPFFSLTSIILCDILDLEALTNAYGIVTMVRGIASTVGSPVAGMMVEETGTFMEAFQIAGVMVIVGGVLYIAIIFYERTRLNKSRKSAVNNEQGRM